MNLAISPTTLPSAAAAAAAAFDKGDADDDTGVLQ
jgi:hypothetical protein